MTKAVIAPQDGFLFQAGIFWKYAACLLEDDSSIEKVSFEENEYKSFDDVVIKYNPRNAPRDQKGNPYYVECIQCKWHTKMGYFSSQDMIDPKFINATSKSFLEKLKDAYDKSKVENIRFQLISPYQPDNILCEYINTDTHTVSIDKLFSGSTDRSEAGKIRKAWREKLGVDDNELKNIIEKLALKTVVASLQDFLTDLHMRFEIVGLKPITVDIVYEWMRQGYQEFDKETLYELCKRDNLLLEEKLSYPKRIPTYGIRSFEHRFLSLDVSCDDVLDFVPSFCGRYINNRDDWNNKLMPQIKNHLVNIGRRSNQFKLVLDTHTTIAFMAGSIINLKSGLSVSIEQRTPNGTEIWKAGDKKIDNNCSKLEFKTSQVDKLQSDIAIAIGITHDIQGNVESHIKQFVPTVQCVLHASLESGASNKGVDCGAHAFALVEQLIRHVNTLNLAEKKIHLFISAPNAFSFFLGQRSNILGNIQLYEYDFEKKRDGSYTPSANLN